MTGRMMTMNQIESMLLELKDTSDFMVDLAYSSLLYNNTDIAEEVIFLEGKMDELSKSIQDYVVKSGKEHPEDIARSIVIIRLQMAAEDIADAAASIADVVLRGLSEHPVIQMSIQESEVTIERTSVSANSVMAGRTLGDLRLGTNCGMYVIAVKRGNRYIYGPDRDFVVMAGDALIAKGPEEGADQFIGLADGTVKEL
jgi:uncharacterized protein with PhoU and TrkA domain